MHKEILTRMESRNITRDLRNLRHSMQTVIPRAFDWWLTIAATAEFKLEWFHTKNADSCYIGQFIGSDFIVLSPHRRNGGLGG